MKNQYIAFKDKLSGERNPQFKIYKFDGKDWFLNIEDANKGFQVSDTEKYGCAFLRSETLEGIKEEIRKTKHIEKFGDGKEGRASCPKCGYKYSFDYYDCNDGFYTAAIIEDFSQVVACVCGCRFEAKIKVEVSFETKILIDNKS